MANKCSVLINSCDKYEDAWYPFFSLLEIMWKDCSYPVFLNTETKNFSHLEIDINVLHPNSLYTKRNKEISWSERLRQALNKIDSEYVITLLEDFFLMSPVRDDMIEKCIDIMDNNENIGVIDFYHEPHIATVIYDEFSEVDKNFDYCINAMACLWRKSFLLEILRDEDPWKFEFFGTYRWRKTDYKILTHREEFKPVFDYKIKPKYGYGIYQGKWLEKNQELFEKYNIEVDFSKREILKFEDLPPLEAELKEEDWLKNDFKKAFKDPKLFFHYVKCAKNIAKDKLIRFYAQHFNL